MGQTARGASSTSPDMLHCTADGMLDWLDSLDEAAERLQAAPKGSKHELG